MPLCKQAVEGGFGSLAGELVCHVEPGQQATKKAVAGRQRRRHQGKETAAAPAAAGTACSAFPTSMRKPCRQQRGRSVPDPLLWTPHQSNGLTDQRDLNLTN